MEHDRNDDGCRTTQIVKADAKRALVGAGARILFYPTLLYNVFRNKIQAEFRWWDEVDQVYFTFIFIFSGLFFYFFKKFCDLLYNPVVNFFFFSFHLVTQFLLLGAVPFPKDVPRLKQLGVGGVITLNEPYETLVPSSLYHVGKFFFFLFCSSCLMLYEYQKIQLI